MYFQKVHGLHSQDVKPAKQSSTAGGRRAMWMPKTQPSTALSAIDDWLDEEIVGFEPEGVS